MCQAILIFPIKAAKKLLKDGPAFEQRYVEVKQNNLDLIFSYAKVITLLQRYTVDKKRGKRRI